MKREQPTELAIIQKAYDLIQWYIPHLTKLPRHSREDDLINYSGEKRPCDFCLH